MPNYNHYFYAFQFLVIMIFPYFLFQSQESTDDGMTFDEEVSSLALNSNSLFQIVHGCKVRIKTNAKMEISVKLL